MIKNLYVLYFLVLAITCGVSVTLNALTGLHPMPFQALMVMAFVFTWIEHESRKR